MVKFLRNAFCILMGMLLGSSSFAQTTINTNLTATTTTSPGGVTFVVENSNASPILLTNVGYYVNTSDNNATYQLYYSSTSLSGPQPTAWPAAGWTLVHSQVLSGITTTGIQNIMNNLTFMIPATTTYRFSLVKVGSIPLYASSGANTFSAAGVFLRIGNYQINGQNVGYAYTISPRYWAGSITFVPAGPCTAPPTPGTANASTTTPCFGQQIELSLTGNSFGLGQTYQWQQSTSPTGPWTNISTASSASTFNYTPAIAGTRYYRAAVTCGSSTTYSTPVSINVPTAFAGGTYTINPALPASATNFQSFSAAVSAISCGITGHVVFNVSPGTYTEQIDIPQTVNSNSGRTVTFNGNGATLQYTINSSGGNYATLNLDGVNHFTFNDLNVQALGASYGYALHAMNAADSNNFNNCSFTVPISATSTNTIPVVFSGSTSSYSTAGNNANYNAFDSCEISGGYFAMTLYGQSGTNNIGNSFTNCHIKDFYVYGAYFVYQQDALFHDNIVERPTRTNMSTTYPIMFSTGCVGVDIQNNIIRNLFAMNPNYSATTYCIYVSQDGTAANPQIIANNVIYGVNNNSTTAGLYLTGVDYVKAYHNTIILDNPQASTGTIYGIYTTGTIANSVDIRNNIIHIGQSGSGTKYGIYSNSHTSYPKEIDYNNIYITSTSGSNYIGYTNTTYSTLAAWQNGTGYDLNSVQVNPQYVNNFIPTNPLMSYKGIGIPSVPTDIFDSVRNPATPDIGAVEYTEPPVCGTVTLPFMLTAQADRDTTCTNGIINLSVLQNVPAGSSIAYRWEYKTNTMTNWQDFGAPLQPTSNYQVLNVPEPRWYRVAVYCDTLAVLYSDSVFVETVTPNIDITSDVLPGTICSGTPITFSSTNDNTGNAPSYQWQVNGVNVGGNSDTYSQASWTGNADVRAIITGDPTHFCAGFTDTSNVLQFFVVPTVTPDVAINSDAPNNTTCDDKAIHFTTVATNQGNNPIYDWQVNGMSIGNNNPDLYISTLNDGDVVRCIITSDALCKTRAQDTSNQIQMTVYTPVAPVITKNGNVLSTTTPYSSYQWMYNNAMISGATNPTYTATQVGNYWVQVVDANGCPSESNAIWVPFVLGITDLGKNALIKLYPNPASDKVRIDSKEEVRIRVWNGVGQLVLEASSIKEVDVQNWTNGTYLFEISNLKGEVLMRERILKNN